MLHKHWKILMVIQNEGNNTYLCDEVIVIIKIKALG